MEHISASQLSMMEKCGEQWYRRYVKKEKRPPGIAACTGTALHKSAEKALTYKCENDGEVISLEQMQDTARDALEAATKEDGLFLNSEEWKTGKEKIVGQAKDYSVKLAKTYHGELLPVINPLSADSLEKEFLIELEGFDFDLKGFVDVVEEKGFRDLKTFAKTPTQESVDKSDQYTFYALWYFAKNGDFPETIIQDSLVKKKEPVADIKYTTRRTEDFHVLSNKLESFSFIVKSGVFPHASSLGWWCSPKWCGYYDTCKYTRNPVSVPVK